MQGPTASTLVDMNTTRISVLAATAAAAFWALKAVAIGTAGGLNKSPLEGPLFFLGLLCFVVAVCSLALAVVGGRRWWTRAAAVAGGVVTVALFAVISGIAVDTLATTDHWVWGELTLWLASLAVLAGCVWHASRPRLRTA